MSKPVKPSNSELSEFLKIGQAIKTLTKAHDALKSQIKAYGAFETNEFIVSVSNVEQNRVVDAPTLLEALGPVLVTKHALIKTSSYEKIGVERKEIGKKSA